MVLPDRASRYTAPARRRSLTGTSVLRGVHVTERAATVARPDFSPRTFASGALLSLLFQENARRLFLIRQKVI
ncbi:hypothetical protein EMIT0158MI4_20239 [Burkholderia ambifaria]